MSHYCNPTHRRFVLVAGGLWRRVLLPLALLLFVVCTVVIVVEASPRHSYYHRSNTQCHNNNNINNRNIDTNPSPLSGSASPPLSLQVQPATRRTIPTTTNRRRQQNQQQQRHLAYHFLSPALFVHDHDCGEQPSLSAATASATAVLRGGGGEEDDDDDEGHDDSGLVVVADSEFVRGGDSTKQNVFNKHQRNENNKYSSSNKKKNSIDIDNVMKKIHAVVANMNNKILSGINNHNPQHVLVGSASLIILVAVLIRYREALRPLMDKHYIQEHALAILNHLQERPYAVPLYMMGMALWEFLGLSTIPVETAAGMVFGFSRGLVASGGGKLLGACSAFACGRTVLAKTVRTKCQQNPVWSVVDQSTDVYSPLAVALLMKFSCFPEFIKNFGSSCLDMRFGTFATAASFHGLLFTTLWTMLGVDAAKRLEHPDELLPANISLQVSLVVAALIGLVGSPLLMAWWIRDMKRRISTTTSSSAGGSSVDAATAVAGGGGLLSLPSSS